MARGALQVRGAVVPLPRWLQGLEELEWALNGRATARQARQARTQCLAHGREFWSREGRTMFSSKAVVQGRSPLVDEPKWIRKLFDVIVTASVLARAPAFWH